MRKPRALSAFYEMKLRLFNAMDFLFLGIGLFLIRTGFFGGKFLVEELEKYVYHSFYPDKDSFYCSQYIAEILPIFKTIPMQFGDGEKAISDYWEDYYKNLGLYVPLGLEGTNPSQLSESEKLKFLGELK